MSNSPLLALPYLAASQAQKHVTLNEALSILDGLLHLAVITRSLATPPTTPADGDRYLIAASPTAAWAGHAGKIALRMAGAWRFLTPQTGWRIWISNETVLQAFLLCIFIRFYSIENLGGCASHIYLFLIKRCWPDSIHTLI